MSTSAEHFVYLDASALVKLVVTEKETPALKAFLASHTARVSSALVRVEVPLAVHRHGPGSSQRAARLIARIDLIALDDETLDAAGRLHDVGVRSLDAIHVASALRLEGEVSTLVTYDKRMQDAAVAVGLRWHAPGP